MRSGPCLDAVLREQAQRAAQVCHSVALHATPVSDQLPLDACGSVPESEYHSKY